MTIIVIHLVIYGSLKRDELNVNDINTALTNDNILHLGVRPVLLVRLVQMEENKA